MPTFTKIISYLLLNCRALESSKKFVLSRDERTRMIFAVLCRESEHVIVYIKKIGKLPNPILYDDDGLFLPFKAGGSRGRGRGEASQHQGQSVLQKQMDKTSPPSPPHPLS